MVQIIVMPSRDGPSGVRGHSEVSLLPSRSLCCSSDPLVRIYSVYTVFGPGALLAPDAQIFHLIRQALCD